MTTPSNELGRSVQRSAPFLIVRTPTVEGKYTCMSTKKTPGSDRETTPGASTAQNSTICPESQKGLPSYPPFTNVEFFDGARLLVVKISHHSDTHRGGKVLLHVNQKTPGRTGKQHQVPRLLKFVYHLP